MGTYDKDAARQYMGVGHRGTVSPTQIAAVGDKEDSNYVSDGEQMLPCGNLRAMADIHRQGNGILQQVEKGMQCKPSTWTQRSLIAILGHFNPDIGRIHAGAQGKGTNPMELVVVLIQRLLMDGDLLPFTHVWSVS
jgi:hypothetical protein